MSKDSGGGLRRQDCFCDGRRRFIEVVLHNGDVPFIPAAAAAAAKTGLKTAATAAARAVAAVVSKSAAAATMAAARAANASRQADSATGSGTAAKAATAVADGVSEDRYYISLEFDLPQAPGTRIVASIVGFPGSTVVGLVDIDRPTLMQFATPLVLRRGRPEFIALDDRPEWRTVHIQSEGGHGGIGFSLRAPIVSELGGAHGSDCYYDTAGARRVWDITPVDERVERLRFVCCFLLPSDFKAAEGQVSAGIIGSGIVTKNCATTDGLLAFQDPLELVVDPRCQQRRATAGKPWAAATALASHRVSMLFVTLSADVAVRKLVLLGAAVRGVTLPKQDAPGCGPWFAPKLRYHAMAVTGTDVSPFPPDQLMAAYHEVTVTKFPHGNGGTFVTLSGFGGYLGVALAENNIVFSRWNQRGGAPAAVLAVGPGSKQKAFGHEGSGQQLKHALAASVGDRVGLFVRRRSPGAPSDVSAWFRVGEGPWQFVVRGAAQ